MAFLRVQETRLLTSHARMALAHMKRDVCLASGGGGHSDHLNFYIGVGETTSDVSATSPTIPTELCRNIPAGFWEWLAAVLHHGAVLG